MFSGFYSFEDIHVRILIGTLMSAFLLASCTNLAEIGSGSNRQNANNVIDVSPAVSTNSADTSHPENGSTGGTIVGSVFSSSLDSPLKFYMVYLGEKLLLTPGPDYLLTFEKEASPKAKTDEEGYFEVTDVQPGEYALIVWTPHNSYVITDESGEKEQIVEVINGQTTDLGLLVVEWP